jgi:hypothetical protein
MAVTAQSPKIVSTFMFFGPLKPYPADPIKIIGRVDHKPERFASVAIMHSSPASRVAPPTFMPVRKGSARTTQPPLSRSARGLLHPIWYR